MKMWLFGRKNKSEKKSKDQSQKTSRRLPVDQEAPFIFEPKRMWLEIPRHGKTYCDGKVVYPGIEKRTVPDIEFIETKKTRSSERLILQVNKRKLCILGRVLPSDVKAVTHREFFYPDNIFSRSEDGEGEEEIRHPIIFPIRFPDYDHVIIRPSGRVHCIGGYKFSYPPRKPDDYDNYKFNGGPDYLPFLRPMALYCTNRIIPPWATVKRLVSLSEGSLEINFSSPDYMEEFKKAIDLQKKEEQHQAWKQQLVTPLDFYACFEEDPYWTPPAKTLQLATPQIDNPGYIDPSDFAKRVKRLNAMIEMDWWLESKVAGGGSDPIYRFFNGDPIFYKKNNVIYNYLQQWINYENPSEHDRESIKRFGLAPFLQHPGTSISGHYSGFLEGRQIVSQKSSAQYFIKGSGQKLSTKYYDYIMRGVTYKNSGAAKYNLVNALGMQIPRRQNMYDLERKSEQIGTQYEALQKRLGSHRSI